MSAVTGLLLLACSRDSASREESCARVEGAWSVEVIPASSAAAPGATEVARSPLRDVSSASKLAVAVYHFNVQYVAGGLVGFPDGELVEKYDLDEAEVEDRIVRQG